MDEPQTLRTLSSYSTLHVPTFGLPTRGQAADLADELHQARRELDAGRHIDQTPLLRVFEESEVPLSLEYSSYEDGLIEDAKANIAAGNIELALAQIDEVLELVPGHHEARYLRAYCLLSSNRDMAALTELESLRASQLEPELAEQILELRATLRGRLSSRLLASQDEESLAEYLRLVPEEGQCWVGLTLLRAQRGDLPGAIAAAQAGVGTADAETDRHVLDRLTYQLRLHMLRALMSAVIALLHENAYEPALEELRRRLDPVWNDFQPVSDLVGYILQSARHGPGRPDLPRDRADVVYDLLAGRDLAQAHALLDEGRPERGLPLLRRSVGLVPTDPVTNFMLAVCLLATDGNLDEIETRARAAATDERINSAVLLLDAVALRRVDQEAVAIQDLVGDLNKCRPARIKQALERTRALHTRAKGLLQNIGEPFRDQLLSLLRILAENAVQLNLALLSKELTRVLQAGLHRGMRAELDQIIRRCAALKRATRQGDTRRIIGQIEQAARTARERA